jgi:RsiW-degrading membrane proteinase PrsW (M82 family)
MGYFHSRGPLGPARRRVAWISFGLGALATLPAFLLAAPSGVLGSRIADPLAYGLFGALFTAAVPEEALKLLVLTRYSMRHLEEPFHGTVYGVCAALGFATLESVFYLVRGGGGVAAIRALTSVPGHAFFGAILGYYVGRAKFARADAHGLIAKGLLIAIGLHAAYDLPLLVTAHLKKAGAAYANETAFATALMLLSPVALVCSGVVALLLAWLDRKSETKRHASPVAPIAPPLASRRRDHLQ